MGGKNRTTLAREAAVAASGTTPLAMMIKTMRAFEAFADRHANNAKKFEYYSTRAAAIAKDVAPYIHPRIPPPAPPPRKVSFPLPDIVTAADVVAASAAVMAACRAGQITAAEANEVSNVIEQHRKAIETAEIAARVVAIEQQQKRDSKE
ncbi:hypothetical protein ABIB00_005041 [Bradyrhizobium sp. LB14.3]|uniref:hypothetical protein n=1 Tax=Bradyrhizobium sp. LB14.3 TaxID=3156328 RepID=UPI00339943F9